MAAEPKRGHITQELLLAAFAGPSATEIEDPRLLQRVASALVAEDVRPGHVLFREGDESEHVHFMSEGRMRLTRPGHADWVYEGRWVVGTTDVLANRLRTRTATMETPARLFHLPGQRWFEVMQDRPEVLLNALVGFARGLAELYSRFPPDGGFARTQEWAHESRADTSTLAGRVRVFAGLPLMHGVPTQILVELAGIAEVRDLMPGDVVFGPGIPPGRVFIVTRGHVEATREDPEIRAVFGVGRIVGGAVCLGDALGAWSARAVDAAQVMSFSNEDLFDHLEEHSEGVRAMMAAAALERERLCEILAEKLGELVLR